MQKVGQAYEELRLNTAIVQFYFDTINMLYVYFQATEILLFNNIIRLLQCRLYILKFAVLTLCYLCYIKLKKLRKKTTPGMDNIGLGHILITVATQEVVVCTIFEIPRDNAGHFFIIYYLKKNI